MEKFSNTGNPCDDSNSRNTAVFLTERLILKKGETHELPTQGGMIGQRRAISFSFFFFFFFFFFLSFFYQEWSIFQVKMARFSSISLIW